jgi:SHS family lactate transporter-like MFS transporter
LNPFPQLRGLTGPQWRAFSAAYLGWMLDAFDFFLLVLVARHIADEFHTTLKVVTYALFLTLAMRPVGALVFGLIADRYGRRPALMGSILLYAIVELLSGFAPSLGVFFVLRAIFGIGMGGEWGVGASLAMESVPARSRGLLSGILQQGYPAGYLLATLVNGFAYPLLGWRGMFFIGAVPAVLVLFIRLGVHESPAWLEDRAGPRGAAARAAGGILAAVRERWPLFLYMVVLMAAFNAFSHGTQDLYPSGFLEKQRGLPLGTVTKIAIIYNLGAITGGILFGALSQKIGRRKAIAAGALLSIPMIPFWVGASTVAGLAAGAFLIQFAVQGAWGVVPAHLNELSPAAVRGTFPGLAYQLGNLGASFIGTLEATLAENRGNDYSFALGWVVGIVAVVLTVLALVGPEARTATLAPEPA